MRYSWILMVLLVGALFVSCSPADTVQSGSDTVVQEGVETPAEEKTESPTKEKTEEIQEEEKEPEKPKETTPKEEKPTAKDSPAPEKTSGKKLSSVDVWAVSDGEKIEQFDIENPLESKNSVWDGSEIELFGVRNEIVAFQLILEAKNNVDDVNVVVSALQDGKNSIGNDFSLRYADEDDVFNSVGRRIELFKQHYLHVKTPSRTLYTANMDNLLGEGYWPDPLIPFEADDGAPFDIQKKSNQGVWVDIYIPKETAPGTYSGTVTVSVGKEKQVIPLSLKVYDATLPDENHMVGFGYIADPWRIAERHGIDNPGSDEYYKVDREYVKMAHRHRVDFMTEREIWHVTQNEADYLTGDMFVNKRGYEGPGEEFGVQTFTPFIEAWDDKAFYLENLQQWDDWFSKHGIDWDKLLYYVWDEPDESDYPWILKRAKWNQEAKKPLAIYLTEHIDDKLLRGKDPEWIDFWSLPGDENEHGYIISKAKERQAKGYRVGAYNGHRPGAGTMLIDDDAISPRTWGWISFKHDVDQWYLWDVTYWKDYQGEEKLTDVWTNPLTFDGSEWDWENVGNGDGTIVYPGQDKVFPKQDRGLAGPISSIRLKNWRRGLQDYEYLWLAEKKGKDTDSLVNDLIPDVFSDARGLKKQSWPTNAAPWEDARKELAEMIS